MTGLIEIHDLSKTFEKGKKAALNNISAIVPQGKIVGLVGPDGAGKTTLLRLLAGLLVPSKGCIRVAGFDTVTEALALHAVIGYMPQKFGLYEDLTVQQNLDLYADLRGVVGEEKEKKLEKLYHFTALSSFKKRLAGALSGGMKQKLGLACALIKKPEVLLLDEPSVGVDPLSRRELRSMVQQLIEEGVSVVWSTSYLDEAAKCDSVLLLNEGDLLFAGDPRELTKKVEGRSFLIAPIANRKREVLRKALNCPEILDGVIQGSSVRVVFRNVEAVKAFDLKKVEAGEAAKLEEVVPTFEDGFMDILGGGPGGTSKLAVSTPLIKEAREIVVEAIHLTKKFGSFTAANDIDFSIKKRGNFWLARPQWSWKINHFQDALWVTNPHIGRGFCQWFRCAKNSKHCKKSNWVYGTEVFSLWQFKRKTKLRVFCWDI